MAELVTSDKALSAPALAATVQTQRTGDGDHSGAGAAIGEVFTLYLAGRLIREA